MDPLSKKLDQLRKKQEINAKYVQASIDAAKRIEENRPVPYAPERSIEEELLDSQFQNSQALDNLKTFMREVDAVKGLNILRDLDDVIDFNSYFPYFQEDTLKKQKNISPPIFRALWLRFKRKLEEEELKAPAVGQEIIRKRIEQPSEQAALQELAGIEGVSEPEMKSMQRELLKAARRRKRGIEEEKIIGEEEEPQRESLRTLDEETLDALRDIVNKGLLTGDSGIKLQNTTYKYGDLLKLYADDKLLFKGQKRTSDEQIKLPDALFDKIRGTVDSFRRVSNKGVSDDLIIKSRQIMYDLNTAYDNLDKTKQDITELKQRYIGKQDNIQYIQRLNELKDKEKRINAEITDLKKGTDALEKDIRDAINETAKEDIAEKRQMYRENKERTEAALAEAKEKLIRGKEFKLREEAEISNLRDLMEDAYDKIKAWNDYMKLTNKGKKEAKRKGKVPERPTDETYRLYNQLIGINMDPNISYEDVMEQLKEINVDIENLAFSETSPRRESFQWEFSETPPRRESIELEFSETPPRRESATEFIQFAPEVEEKKEEPPEQISPKTALSVKQYVSIPVLKKFVSFVDGLKQGEMFDTLIKNYELSDAEILKKVRQYEDNMPKSQQKITRITDNDRDKIINNISRIEIGLDAMGQGNPKTYDISKTAKQKLLTVKGGRLPAKRNISYEKLYTKYGSGLNVSQRFAKPLYAPFGQYALHLPSLTKNTVSVKYMSGSHCLPFPKTVISDDLKNMLLDIVEDSKFDESEYMKLSEPEKKLFDDLSSFAKVDLDTSLRMYRHKKYNDADNRKKLERFELLRSQLIAGNDNKNIIRELKPLMLYLQDQKMISRADFNKIMYHILYAV